LNPMRYKGYTGIVELDEDSGMLFGRVIGLRDVITFQGASVPELIQAFHDSVDVYLEFCAERGENPEKPYSGQFVLRVDPQLHRAMAQTAEARGLSLNALIEQTLEQTFGPGGPRPKEPARGRLSRPPEPRRRSAARPLRAAMITHRSKGTVAASSSLQSSSGTTYVIRKGRGSGKGRAVEASKGSKFGKGRRRGSRTGSGTENEGR
jgi:predicted HicB family RNase H-like nuclease